MGRLEETLEGKQKNYIFPFFWQHGEEEAVLREYMQAIYDSNIREVCVESRPHPDFCGEKWWKDMDVILEEAEKRGMRVWILDDSHFPTGFANGAVENAADELKHQYVVYRSLEMSGPIRHAQIPVKEYMKPEPLPPWMPPVPGGGRKYEDEKLLAVIACAISEQGELGESMDLTGQIQGDLLDFDLPDGYWKIYVIYQTKNGKGRNNYINFLDKDSCRLLIDAVYEPHFAHYEKYFGNVIAGFFSDEPPIGNVEGYLPVGTIGCAGQDLPWSKTAAEALTKEYGSGGWKMYLPYLWADAVDKNLQAKMRRAYMDMVTKLVAECFSAQNGTWCREHGVEYIGHMLEDCDMNTNMGASMGHFFRGLSGQDMAGIDNIGGQVTINGQNASRHPDPACPDEAGFYQYLLGKLGASHASIDPKKKGRCMCENFGAYGWQSGTKEQKFMMDHFLVRGVNRFVPHAFSPAPFPDPDCPPHFYAHGENPLYRAFGELMSYTNRVCHLIDGGKACPDVALLYNGESKWAGDADSNIRAARYLTQAQIDFHVIPADVFAADGQYPVTFDGKILKINNVCYRAFVVSGCRFVTGEVAAFITDAVKNGFPVICLDRKPDRIIGASEAENQAFAESMKQTVLMNQEQIEHRMKETLGKYLNPQVSIFPESARIVTYHYRNDRDIYLIFNEAAEQAYCGTIQIGKPAVPLRYYPWENAVEPVAYKETANGLEISLEPGHGIEPLELCIIVLVTEKEAAELSVETETDGKDRQEILQFKVWKLPAKTYLEKKKKEDLISLAEEEGEQVKAVFEGMQGKYPDFSGYYIYEASLQLAAGKEHELEIEDVSESVEVYLNGRSLGMRLQKPFRFRLPAELVKDDNVLRIETATLPERQLASQGIELRGMSAYRPLSPTGILGRVTVAVRR